MTIYAIAYIVYIFMSKTTLLVLIIISLAVVFSITSFWNDSLIVDEIPHVGSGYGYVKALDYRLNPEHPPLAKALAAIPLLFLNLTQTAFETKFWLTDINGQWDFGRFLIFQSGNNADLITRVVKFPMLIFFILSALLVYKWTNKLYGKFAGIISLILFSFSPTIIAHSRFVTTDVPALFGILLASFFFIKYLKEPNRKNLWIAGITFGIAMLTKFSTFLLVPFFIIIAIVYGFITGNRISKLKPLLNTILIFVIGFVFIVWPVYYLFTYNYPPARQAADAEFLLSSFGSRTLANIVVFLADKPVVKGLAQYGLGLLMVAQRAVGGNTTYFLGEVSATGWKYYFPIVYALKEPLPWLILLIISIIFLAWQVNFRNFRFKNISIWLRNHFVEFIMLLWLVIYWTSSIKSNLNIGVRHLLPTYPFAIILVSGQIKRIINYFGRRKVKLFTFYFLLFTFLGWYIFEFVNVWPYYLTYFNQIAGGPSKGYRYVADSNLDWGQDLKRLSKWTEENNIEKIHLDYFGWSDPAYYLKERYRRMWAGKYKNAADFIKQTGGGYLAVSLTFFMGSRENIDTSYLWLENIKPIANIGNSIWVWRVTNQEL